MKQQVFLDTNSLMAIGQHNLSLFEELDRLCGKFVKINILQATLLELEKIKTTSRGKDARSAKLVLQIIQEKSKFNLIKIVEKTGYVDDLLVNESKAGALVVTADLVLQKRLQRPFIIVKQHQYLELKE